MTSSRLQRLSTHRVACRYLIDKPTKDNRQIMQADLRQSLHGNDRQAPRHFCVVTSPDHAADQTLIDGRTEQPLNHRRPPSLISAAGAAASPITPIDRAPVVTSSQRRRQGHNAGCCRCCCCRAVVEYRTALAGELGRRRSCVTVHSQVPNEHRAKNLSQTPTRLNPDCMEMFPLPPPLDIALRLPPEMWSPYFCATPTL